MALSDRLRHVQALKDSPSASQQNLIVDILKGLPPYANARPAKPLDSIRVVDEPSNWEAFTVLQLDAIISYDPLCLGYSSKVFDAPNSDNFEIIICDGAENWGSFGFHPVKAKIAGTSFPAVGSFVGPRHGETDLTATYPGFRFLGRSDIDYVGWVIRDRAIATGQGAIITSSGQSGTPSYFELESVTFSSGFNGWDGTTPLEVRNVFTDTAEAGLIVQFKWDAYTGEYVSTDVECP